MKNTRLTGPPLPSLAAGPPAAPRRYLATCSCIVGPGAHDWLVVEGADDGGGEAEQQRIVGISE